MLDVIDFMKERKKERNGKEKERRKERKGEKGTNKENIKKF